MAGEASNKEQLRSTIGKQTTACADGVGHRNGRPLQMFDIVALGSLHKRFKSNRGSHIGATILHPNTKVLVNQGLFVFLGVKSIPLSPLHLCPDLLVLKARLDIGKNVIDC